MSSDLVTVGSFRHRITTDTGSGEIRIACSYNGLGNFASFVRRAKNYGVFAHRNP